MSVIPKPEMTADEFAAWSARQPKEAGRFELIDGVIVTAMSERVVHARTKMRLARLLDDAAASKKMPCETLVDGPLIRITAKKSYRPDGMLHCGGPLAGDLIEVPDPVLVYEVLSPDSGSRDHGEKVDGYFSRPGIQHYLVVDPARRAVVHHRRGDGDEIIRRVYHSGAIVLDPPGITLSIVGLFAP